MAHTLGMHRDIEKVWQNPLGVFDDPHKTEPRKQLWWSLVGFERLTSTSLGRPSALGDYIGDVPLPSESALYLGNHTPLGYLHSTAALSEILGAVNSQLYEIDITKVNKIATVRALLIRIRRWADLYPLHKLFHISEVADHVRALGFLNLLYQYVVTLTTRPFLYSYMVKYPQVSPEHTDLALECTNAALAALSILDYLNSKKLLINFWFDHFHILNTALCLGCAAKHSAEHRTELARCVALLKNMNPKGTGASLLRGAELVQQRLDALSDVSPLQMEDLTEFLGLTKDVTSFRNMYKI